MNTDDPEQNREYWSLTGDASGDAALIQLISREDPRLDAGNWCLNLAGLKGADTVTAVVARRCIEILRTRAPDGVSIWPPPSAEAIHDRMYDLVGPLPDNAKWAPAPESQGPVRDRHVIVPASELLDDEAVELYTEALITILAAYRLPREAIIRISHGLAELGNNATAYAPHPGLPPFVSVALDPAAEHIGVSIICDPPPLAAAASGEFLSDCIARSHERHGGWMRISARSGARLTLAVGSARSVLTQQGVATRTDSAVDAFCATLSIPVQLL
jgi:hypothetical protein